VAIGSVSALLRSYRGGGPRRPACCNHPETPALTLCRRCGRNLCGECGPASERWPLCRECRSPLHVAWSWAGVHLLSPASVLAVTVLIFSLGYAALGRNRFGELDGTPGVSRDKRRLKRRNWLYYTKAARQKLYADHLASKKRPALAQESYRMASKALEQVLQGMQELYGFRIEEAGRLNLKPAVKQPVAALLIGLAECHRGESRPSEAVAVLEKAIALDPGAAALRASYYRLGRIYEDDLGDCREAVSMYKASQKSATRGPGFLEEFLQVAEKPPDERRFALAMKLLIGVYDPADAQSRIIACYERLGEQTKAERERDALVEEHPFSEQAAEVRKARGEPEDPWENLFPESAEERGAEETLKIIPLEE
jgi:tetratricopeptide (TPR) repeat protein